MKITGVEGLQHALLHTDVNRAGTTEDKSQHPPITAFYSD